jgi:hypothetical protein
MKLIPGLLFILLVMPKPGFAQGIRMSPDFFPLEVGNRWIYDVTNEAGQKIEQLQFEVEDYTIVSGTSFYVLTDFPFAQERRIRLVRYDRQERQFMRVIGDDEGPLFLSEAGSTEVLQMDPSGSPLKFVFRSGSTALVFERGVGIVEAHLDEPGGKRIAKISRVERKGLAGGGPGPAAVSPAPAVPQPGTPAQPLPPPVRTVETITQVTETNPHLDIYAEEAPDGLKLVFIVRNTAEKLLPFKFSSGQSYDFVITEAASGREVWRWSVGQFFTQVIRSEAIRGGGKWTFEELWKRRDNSGQAVPPGQYHLRAILTAQPPLTSPIEVLTVR